MQRHLGARRVPMVNLVRGVSSVWRSLLAKLPSLGARILDHLHDVEVLERNY